ncbi:MAG: DUF2191 domain-containing protein [Alphaproteobacteria bacterium HGW-Alphaproteobacteria-13]|nr:MAG: DUF2191 domain-containing protein [Alphaproteobacteria bacterium HGW-Alphaproteobacteria-13]
MRTNIIIDDALMTDALRATGLKTKREAVELGLRTLVKLDKQRKLKALRGKLDWKGDLDAMRTDA